jgi:hypothetical protein
MLRGFHHMTKRIGIIASRAILAVAFLCGCQTTEHNFRPKHGYVPDAETAIKIAVAVWEPLYGAGHIAGEKPYRARLNNGKWIVEGSLPKSDPEADYVKGGVAIAEITRRDGRILRITHEK